MYDDPQEIIMLHVPPGPLGIVLKYLDKKDGGVIIATIRDYCHVDVKGKLRVGDILMAVNGEPVSHTSDLLRLSKRTLLVVRPPSQASSSDQGIDSSNEDYASVRAVVTQPAQTTAAPMYDFL